MTDPDHPLPGEPEVADVPGDRLGLASEAPLARGAVIASLAGVVVGFCFVPQLLGLALAGLSFARRERAGRRYAVLAVVVCLTMTAVWGVALGLLVKWWAGNQTA